MTAHGLVIGKFYPPHAGHTLLVDTAAVQCGRVTVVVMAASHESIALDTRVGWLREIHGGHTNVTVTGIMDDVRIDYHDAQVWDEHVELMRRALAAVNAPPVTAVFTAETYGVELARRFDAVSVTLDPARTLAPVSATAVRADVAGQWLQLAPPVRRDLALRVVVVGAESTGTTTLSQALAQRLRARGGAWGLTRWVPEYGREYSVQKLANAAAQAQLQGDEPPGFATLPWQAEEFAHISATQRVLEREQAALGGPLLVCDTDAFATSVWQERYVGVSTPEVAAIGHPRADLYLVTHHEGVPFAQDGLRDGEAVREWMTKRFRERLDGEALLHAVLTGSHEARLEQAMAAIEALERRAWKFAAPWVDAMA
ncbi:MAG: transcriptional regulator [Ramlibacter sp.]|nr:transcriptional regulator [Ramlibacter sp.]